MRNKSTIVLEFVLSMVSAYVIWYMSAERPAPGPWIWYRVNVTSRRIAAWSAEQYRDSIEGYFNG